MKLEVNLIQLCPYCQERKIKKKTCGDPVCQYHHHIKVLRDYWDKHYRKTDRTNKPRNI